ncbi:MAG: hypothetical protein AB7G17_02465 [Phycisphaerales bacterium]
MHPHSPPAWHEILDHHAARLRSAAPAPAPLPTNPGPLDAATPFLLHRRLHAPGHITPPKSPAPDAALWWALHTDTLNADLVLRASSDQAARAPLLRRDVYDTIEVWTEGELCALHALWRHAEREHRPDWMDRVFSAISWHLEHTQPDNATNRPWCIAPFVHFADAVNSPDALHYAQTLLHNAAAGPASATILIAEILKDAADMLRPSHTP